MALFAGIDRQKRENRGGMLRVEGLGGTYSPRLVVATVTTPAGVTEISRWSSAATPPVHGAHEAPHPDGMAEVYPESMWIWMRVNQTAFRVPRSLLASLRNARHLTGNRQPVVSLRSTTG